MVMQFHGLNRHASKTIRVISFPSLQPWSCIYGTRLDEEGIEEFEKALHIAPKYTLARDAIEKCTRQIN